jgi:hypothetical protein
VLERSFAPPTWAPIRRSLVEALVEHGPFELVLGPAATGCRSCRRGAVGERELALIVLREDEPDGRAGVGGMRAIVRALIAAGLPLVFGPGDPSADDPGVPQVEPHRLGTADKVASAALCIADQADRLGVGFARHVVRDARARRGVQRRARRDGGRIVDGLGGSSGRRSARRRAARWTARWRICSAPRSRSGPCSAAARATTGSRWRMGAAKAALALTVQRAGPARDPRRGTPRARGGRIARRAAPHPVRLVENACGTRSRDLADGWPAGATRRSSSAWRSVMPPAPCSTTCGPRRRQRLGCAEMALTRAADPRSRRAGGDEHWQALIRHHEMRIPRASPPRATSAGRRPSGSNQLGLGDLKLVETRVERTEPTVRLVHVLRVRASARSAH